MARSAQERLWLIGGGVGALLMVLVGYFLLISPQRDNTSSVNDQVSIARVQTRVLQNRIDALTAENKNLTKYQADVARVRLALPSTSGLPDFLRTLQSIGNATLADVTALTVGPPADVTTLSGRVGAVAAAPPSTTSGAGATAEPSSLPRIYALSITAQISGSVNQLDEFLDQLQSVQPRAVLISQITIGGAPVESGKPGSGVSTLQITMQAFVAPVSAAEAAQLAKAAPR
jgi:hypothetical protein